MVPALSRYAKGRYQVPGIPVPTTQTLDPSLVDKGDVQHLLDSLPEPTLTPRIVSDRVNSVFLVRHRSQKVREKDGHGYCVECEG